MVQFPYLPRNIVIRILSFLPPVQKWNVMDVPHKVGFSDLPMELLLHILTFLPPNRIEMIKSMREAARIGAMRPYGWKLKDWRCRICGKTVLMINDGETRWELRRWLLGNQDWDIQGYYTICPCGEMMDNQSKESLTDLV